MAAPGSSSHPIYVGPLAESSLPKLLASPEFKTAKKFILADENSIHFCLPLLLDQVEALREAEIIEIESGEQNKNIEICHRIWEVLSEMEADRHSVLINLGGGVIGDMGGFIASTFKRGIRFIHIPTTLLAQVDASIGGKVGVDLGSLKNQVGLFSNPHAVFVDYRFLKTLPKREVLSGFAEVIKHALIADVEYWNLLQHFDLSVQHDWNEIVLKSIEIKSNVVKEDPHEKGRRKMLNFGHTIGHALESFFLEQGQNSVTHGEAVAIGIICECWLSHRYRKLPLEQFNAIVHLITNWFPHYPIDEMDFHRLIELMRNDKKNKDQRINFVLLESIGVPSVDCFASADEIKDALRYYISLGR